MPKVPYPYEVNGKLVTGNGYLIPICSLSNRSLLPSLTVVVRFPTFFNNKISQESESDLAAVIQHYETPCITDRFDYRSIWST